MPEPMPQAGPKRETLDPCALWGRVAITEPGGRTIEVDTPSGYTLADWQAYAERYHGPGCTVTPIAPLPSHVLRRHQRPELRRSDARHALAGGP
jgi:hypothetical protein